MAASPTVAGQRVDLGSHRLHPTIAPHLLAALRGLLGDDLQTRPRHGRLRLGDRWIAFPLRAGDAARHLPPGFAARAAGDAVTRPLRRARDDTFAEVVRVRLGRAMLDDFYGPYARKLWGRAPEELDGELARRRISAGGPVALARRLLRGRAGSASGATFLYPRSGYGQIVERLADAAVAAGVSLDLGVGVRAVSVDGPDAVRVALDDGTTLDARRVLWTAPVPVLVAALGDAVPAAVRTAAGCLRHRAMVLAYLAVDRPRWTDFDAHYLPGPEGPVTRVSEPKAYRDGPDPPDRTVLCAEIPCAVGDATWTADDSALGALVVDTLARADLPPVPVAGVETRRLPHVYPVLDVAGRAARGLVDAWTATGDLGSVTVLGRQGLFVADNLHHVMAMGWDAGELAAREARTGSWPVPEWTAARAAYRTHVVED
jgi:protoporphyrinogen oxidase